MKSSVTAAFLLSLVFFSFSAISAEGPDPAKALAGADWSKMETVTVTMNEYSFSPSPIVLKEGVPTRLVLKNAGKEAHYFVAERFFRGIATRKVQGSDGEIKAPFFTAVEVYPGKMLEWFLVPARKGVYELLCTVKGHAEHGMKGKIEVR
ncbi:cupredoxin domain-containing protein [Candidatus Deferrimicrobium sp.]|jgi:uncharacterized cupredoxin-like copper-binding protein|uniref:cupredoxin domain-containing protein n=1 Tax=Candidatus Deferrimicrobium sp. TaxID=3060586 RepID=UPI002ED9B948